MELRKMLLPLVFYTVMIVKIFILMITYAIIVNFVPFNVTIIYYIYWI